MKILYPMSIALVLGACQSPAATLPESSSSLEKSAALGVSTSVPSEALAREMGLEFQVRLQGRLVDSVSEESAAEAAGIRSGDVLLQLDDVALYSQDDIDDFVSVHRPGDRVRATVVRGETHRREELPVELGTGPARAKDGIDWQYASLAQLPAALEEARAEKKQVLVGLSGAET